MNPQTLEELTAEGCWPGGRPARSPGNPGEPQPGAPMLRHFSHRCRNFLSGIKLGLYVLKDDLKGSSCAHWGDLVHRYDEIERLFDRLDRICQSTSLTLVRSPLGHLFAERLPLWRSRFPDWGRALVLEPPEQDLAGDFDPSHLGLGLDALIAWRAEAGEGRKPSLAWRSTAVAAQDHLAGNRREGANQNRSGLDRPLESPLGDCGGAVARLLLARVAADHRGVLEARREPALALSIRWPQFRDGERVG